MTQLHQFTTFINYFWLRQTLFSSQLTTGNLEPAAPFPQP